MTPSQVNPAIGAGTFRGSMLERVHWGAAAGPVLCDELDRTGASRVMVVTNRSLAESDLLQGLKAELGDRLSSVYAGVTAHSPRRCVIEGAQQARVCGAEMLVAIGGGSVIDAAKAMLLCLRHGWVDTHEMTPYANVRTVDVSRRPLDADRWKRVIAVPTTLSGAEFAASAGVSNPDEGLKHAFVHPMQMPVAVVLDPAMTLATPIELLLSTGLKAVDHAAERMTSSNANPYSDAVSELALRELGSGLYALKQQPGALETRAKLQFGMFMSLQGSASGVAVNVSHAIGHVLGAHAHVPHGQTTGVTLPAVLTWCKEVTGDAQARIARALGSDAGDAAAAVLSLARRLDLPTRLRDVGIGRDDLPVMAQKTMKEAMLSNSSKPVRSANDIAEILDLAW